MATGGNSFNHPEKESGADKSSRTKDLKRFSGVGSVKKRELTGFWKWMAGMFFNGRTWKDICKDIVENQIVPELKDGFRNAIVSLIDMRIYKDSTGPRNYGYPGWNAPSSGWGGSPVANYVDYTNAQARQKQKAKLEENKANERNTINQGYENPAFRTKQEADNFLKAMHDYCHAYDTISVYQIAYMSGRDIDYTWDAWGWNSEEILEIKGTKYITNSGANGYKYTIDLPKAHTLE